jgi:hypothetical protein
MASDVIHPSSPRLRLPYLISDKVLFEQVLSGQLLGFREVIDLLPHQKIGEGDSCLYQGAPRN